MLASLLTTRSDLDAVVNTLTRGLDAGLAWSLAGNVTLGWRSRLRAFEYHPSMPGSIPARRLPDHCLRYLEH
jgi:hypothetical protein